MKVKDLKKILENQNDERDVVIEVVYVTGAIRMSTELDHITFADDFLYLKGIF